MIRHPMLTFARRVVLSLTATLALAAPAGAAEVARRRRRPRIDRAGYELGEPPSALPCLGGSGWFASSYLPGDGGLVERS